MESIPHPRKEPRFPEPITKENICDIFRDAADFDARQVFSDTDTIWVFSIDGLTSGADITDYVVKPLMQAGEQVTGDNLTRYIIYSSVASPCEDLDAVASKLVNGFCVVLLGDGTAVSFEAKTGEKRSISQPEVENTIKGAKDAFTETIRTNTSLLRRHLRAPELRLSEQIVGRQSLTNVTVCYLEGLTDAKKVEAVKERLETIDIDGMLTPAAVEEYLTGNRKTAFPLLIYTERADRFAWGLLTGKVGILVDGLPLGYLLPCNVADFLESPEDRGSSYVVASGVKLLRYMGIVASLLLPGFFVAISLFHQEMIPAALMEAIVESRQAVPFSTGAEVIILLFAFELLQEAGLHLPQNLGQAVSIIGGLVVGSAAVDANLISPGALIAVAAAGVCGFALPSKDYSDAIRVWRFFITVSGLLAGLAGMVLVLIWMLLHLGDLRSLGQPYLGTMAQGLLPRLRNRLVVEKNRPAANDPVNIRKQR